MRTTSSSPAAREELLENEVKPLVANFLKTRGLELSPEKTSITHIEKGFDFLGWNVRKYDNGMLIKPSKKSVQTFMRKVRALVKATKASAAIGTDRNAQSVDSWLGELSSMRSCRKDLPWVELADLADSMAVGEASSSQ